MSLYFILSKSSTCAYPFARLVVLWITISLCLCSKVYALELKSTQKQALDRVSPDIAELTSAYLSSLSNTTSPQIAVKPSNPKYLSELSEWLSIGLKKSRLYANNEKKYHEAYILATEVHRALPDIRLDIDTKNTAIFIRALLNANDIKTATDLSEEIFENASYLTGAAVRFQLACYYFALDDIESTLQYLLAIDAQEALSKDEQDYAALMLGVTLQKQKKHREAAKIYKKITPESNYFQHSQLNRALAFILQGWWTDAELAINEVSKHKTSSKRGLFSPNESELDLPNRTLLFLAYSQLKYEYYRNARNSLRKISLNSPYVNKALLAMGLAALNQKDFLGAINAFSRLKNAKTDELSKTEAYLMAAFTYESMGDLSESEKLYTEALAFFANETLYWQKKILETNNQQTFFEKIEKYRFSYSAMQKFYFLNKIDISSIPSGIKQDYNKTQSNFNDIVRKALIQYYQQQIQFIESYQSQSQYALARLYDANQ